MTISESLLVKMAETTPGDLAALVLSGSLSTVELSLAAEAAGVIADPATARAILDPLLSHPSPLVREGAIYGLSAIRSGDVSAEIQAIATNDTHSGVRRAAKAILDSWRAQ